LMGVGGVIRRLQVLSPLRDLRLNSKEKCSGPETHALPATRRAMSAWAAFNSASGAELPLK